VSLSLQILYERNTADGGTETTTSYLRSKSEVVLNTNDLAANLEGALRQFHSRDESFVEASSGWRSCNVSNFVLYMAQYDPLGGSSFVPTPAWLVKKMALVNIQTSDNLCFLHGVLAVSHPQKDHANRVTKYHEFLEELTYDDFSFPMTIDQIPRFEDLNTDYAINVIYPCCEDKFFIPIYASKHRNRKHIVNLLLLDRSEKRRDSRSIPTFSFSKFASWKNVFMSLLPPLFHA